ncbi:endonuclease/exonuclease/phosphatase family protein [Tropicimonas sediminicola]|uniref:Endonuclease/Exonuclease/phosphatase family protein n=1 Tax=Tropicimonas sediminicola TaxID=1031541 RepID=A0A239II41_9RHOB|nr:endonuclease/exonuclease/phosphatase family protein [Tropicimonas sediminicola]SNS93287.1 Endonuclease/Exonuclease/phosphatase family protein [Tropicimonas sediminicola]
MRIATFNVQNLRLRQLAGGEAALDGARDGDVPTDTDEDAPAFDKADRRLTAAVLHDMNADVVALQEVHDQETLDYFHERFLVRTGLRPYPHRICLPGNDGMGRNLALLSRLPPSALQSHAGLRPSDLGLAPLEGVAPDRPLFCRDCLMVDLPGITLYLCHFKAPYPDADATRPARRLEALGVRRLIENRFARPERAMWMILGDLNEPDAQVPLAEKATAPLLDDFAIDLLERRPRGQRWSYHEPRRGTYSRPDALLASPALAAACPLAMPRLVREGMGREATAYPGPRLHGVGEHRPHASDHAAIMVDLEGIGA